MKESVKIAELYDLDAVSYIAPLLARYVYPWELLEAIPVYLQRLLSEGIAGYTLYAKDVLIGEGVKISPTVTIEGPCVIGAGSELRPGAYLRGNVLTGEGCVIGNSTELKNCILLSHVQVPHYNYVGDSVLGNHAHLGAGAICSNLKADGRAVTVHGTQTYDTGRRKVGAFLGDRVDVGCGCVLNPGTVIGKDTRVYPLTALRGVFMAGCIVKSADQTVPRADL